MSQSLAEPTGSPVLRGFSRSAKQDSEESEANGGAPKARCLRFASRRSPNYLAKPTTLI
jgi:hypothetical protein